MARTQILPSDPGAVKKWEDDVAVEQRKKSHFTKLTGTEDDYKPVVRKMSLESGIGDEVTMYLIAKLVGKPIEGQEKGEGREERLNHYTDKIRIDKHRKLVNAGDIMDQKRVPFDILKQAKRVLSDWAAEVHDEQITMCLSGGRGVGAEIQHYPLGYAGFPNAFTAPDAGHQITYDGSIAYNQIDNALSSGLGHALNTNVIDAANLKAKKMIGDVVSGKAMTMTPCSAEGGKHFVMLTGAEGMKDLRDQVGDAGFLTLQKAAITAEGQKNVIFTGGRAFHNGVLLDEMQTIVKFSNAGAGGTSRAMRTLFLGAHAAAVAYGTRGQNNGSRYQLSDSDLDHGEEDVVVLRLIAGYKKCRFNGMDCNVLSVDHSYRLAPGSSI